MEKINIAQLLKDCPQGMELDCTMFENVTFVRVDDNREQFPIEIMISGLHSEYLTKEGCFHDTILLPESKCIIFPKGKTTWDGFVPPCKFKDGDILYVKSNEKNEYIIIFKEIKNDHIHKYVCFAYQHLSIDKCALCHLVDAEIMRLATEEEMQKLFDAIKANGYKWNAETKTLEKLPKFKVGDRVKKNTDYISGIVTDIFNDSFKVTYDGGCCSYVQFQYQHDWELVSDKFDITTLKPFDKVLVAQNKGEWHIQFFEKYSPTSKFPFICIGGSVYQKCVPYEVNKHLMGTTNDCDEFYKTWE